MYTVGQNIDTVVYEYPTREQKALTKADTFSGYPTAFLGVAQGAYGAEDLPGTTGLVDPHVSVHSTTPSPHLSPDPAGFLSRRWTPEQPGVPSGCIPPPNAGGTGYRTVGSGPLLTSVHNDDPAPSRIMGPPRRDGEDLSSSSSSSSSRRLQVPLKDPYAKQNGQQRRLSSPLHEPPLEGRRFSGRHSGGLLRSENLVDNVPAGAQWNVFFKAGVPVRLLLPKECLSAIASVSNEEGHCGFIRSILHHRVPNLRDSVVFLSGASREIKEEVLGIAITRLYGDSGAQKALLSEKDGFLGLVILVPEKAVSLVIGSKGTTINRISKACNCEIRILTSIKPLQAPGPTDRTILIRSKDPTHMTAGILAVTQILSEMFWKHKLAEQDFLLGLRHTRHYGAGAKTGPSSLATSDPHHHGYAGHGASGVQPLAGGGRGGNAAHEASRRKGSYEGGTGKLGLAGESTECCGGSGGGGSGLRGKGQQSCDPPPEGLLPAGLAPMPSAFSLIPHLIRDVMNNRKDSVNLKLIISKQHAAWVIGNAGSRKKTIEAASAASMKILNHSSGVYVEDVKDGRDLIIKGCPTSVAKAVHLTVVGYEAQERRTTIQQLPPVRLILSQRSIDLMAGHSLSHLIHYVSKHSTGAKMRVTRTARTDMCLVRIEGYGDPKVTATLLILQRLLHNERKANQQEQQQPGRDIAAFSALGVGGGGMGGPSRSIVMTGGASIMPTHSKRRRLNDLGDGTNIARTTSHDHGILHATRRCTVAQGRQHHPANFSTEDPPPHPPKADCYAPVKEHRTLSPGLGKSCIDQSNLEDLGFSAPRTTHVDNEGQNRLFNEDPAEAHFLKHVASGVTYPKVITTPNVYTLTVSFDFRYKKLVDDLGSAAFHEIEAMVSYRVGSAVRIICVADPEASATGGALPPHSPNVEVDNFELTDSLLERFSDSGLVGCEEPLGEAHNPSPKPCQLHFQIRGTPIGNSTAVLLLHEALMNLEEKWDKEALALTLFLRSQTKEKYQKQKPVADPHVEDSHLTKTPRAAVSTKVPAEGLSETKEEHTPSVSQMPILQTNDPALFDTHANDMSGPLPGSRTSASYTRHSGKEDQEQDAEMNFTTSPTPQPELSSTVMFQAESTKEVMGSHGQETDANSGDNQADDVKTIFPIEKQREEVDAASYRRSIPPEMNHPSEAMNVQAAESSMTLHRDISTTGAKPFPINAVSAPSSTSLHQGEGSSNEQGTNVPEEASL